MSTFTLVSGILCLIFEAITCFSKRNSLTEFISTIALLISVAMLVISLFITIGIEKHESSFVKCDRYQVDTFVSMTNQVPTDTTYIITYSRD